MPERAAAGRAGGGAGSAGTHPRGVRGPRRQQRREALAGAVPGGPPGGRREDCWHTGPEPDRLRGLLRVRRPRRGGLAGGGGARHVRPVQRLRQVDPERPPQRPEVRGRLAHGRPHLRQRVLVRGVDLPGEARREDALRRARSRDHPGADVQDPGGALGLHPEHPLLLVQPGQLRRPDEELQPLLERGRAVPAEHEGDTGGGAHAADLGEGRQDHADPPAGPEQPARELRRRPGRGLHRRLHGGVAAPRAPGRPGPAPQALHRPLGGGLRDLHGLAPGPHGEPAPLPAVARRRRRRRRGGRQHARPGLRDVGLGPRAPPRRPAGRVVALPRRGLPRRDVPAGRAGGGGPGGRPHAAEAELPGGGPGLRARPRPPALPPAAPLPGPAVQHLPQAAAPRRGGRAGERLLQALLVLHLRGVPRFGAEPRRPWCLHQRADEGAGRGAAVAPRVVEV
mmetsp:Transcript_109399/g.309498  ORF Transcript_109399/g.309498 Transcript_109399/m.309498 type:complete len:452 (+) Transcript_109399:554-1909(+)